MKKEAIFFLMPLFSISVHRYFWLSSLSRDNAKSPVSDLLRQCRYHHGNTARTEAEGIDSGWGGKQTHEPVPAA